MQGLQEARRKVARVAMADLIGGSEPPEGKPDNYPFNACAWRDSYPVQWYEILEQVIRFVYHNETIPADCR